LFFILHTDAVNSQKEKNSSKADNNRMKRMETRKAADGVPPLIRAPLRIACFCPDVTEIFFFSPFFRPVAVILQNSQNYYILPTIQNPCCNWGMAMLKYTISCG
jgi:hypothetical protein